MDIAKIIELFKEKFNSVFQKLRKAIILILILISNGEYPCNKRVGRVFANVKPYIVHPSSIIIKFFF